MIVRSEVSPAAGSGPVVGGTSMRTDAQHLQCLVEERERTLASLRREREPKGIDTERFYGALSELLEQHVNIAIGEWNGRIPK